MKSKSNHGSMFWVELVAGIDRKVDPIKDGYLHRCQGSVLMLQLDSHRLPAEGGCFLDNQTPIVSEVEMVRNPGKLGRDAFVGGVTGNGYDSIRKGLSGCWCEPVCRTTFVDWCPITDLTSVLTKGSLRRCLQNAYDKKRARIQAKAPDPLGRRMLASSDSKGALKSLRNTGSICIEWDHCLNAAK